MIIIFKKKNVDDDTTDFELKLSNGELNFLVNFALESLVQMGSISVNDQLINQEQEIELPLPPEFIPPTQVN
jgi:hypothetical protein